MIAITDSKKKHSLTPREKQVYDIVSQKWSKMDYAERQYGFDIDQVSDWTGWGKTGSRPGVWTTAQILERLYQKGKLDRYLEEESLPGISTWRYRVKESGS